MSKLGMKNSLDKEFIVVSEQELLVTKGGVVISLTTGAIIGLGLAVAVAGATGATAGYYANRP